MQHNRGRPDSHTPLQSAFSATAGELFPEHKSEWSLNRITPHLKLSTKSHSTQ